MCRGRALKPVQPGAVRVRALRRSDAPAWVELRDRNRERLAPWEAVPPGSVVPPVLTRAAFRTLLRSSRRSGSLPFAVLLDDVLVGQVVVSGVQRGAALTGSVGYWVDVRVEGRGVASAAVALVVDHCLDDVGLHRVEADVQAGNAASRRVLEKLGFRYEGTRRGLLHVQGEWRDHELWALLAEDVPPGGVRGRLSAR